MKVISFDVGIKHLAYCVLTWDAEAGVRVVDWKVVDVSGNDESPCQGVLKKGKPCARKSVAKDAEGKSFCRMHAKNRKTVDLVRKSTASVDLLEISKNVVRNLDRLGEFDTVLIEQQPGKNPKMETISQLIWSYYVIRNLDLDPQIKFVPARNKLSFYDGPEIPCNLKGQYARNKFFGKKYCEYFLKDPNWVSFYHSQRKKDDLADSFLQGTWYLLQLYQVLPKSPQLGAVFESNRLKYREIRARKPTDRQLQSGRVLLSGLKFYLGRGRKSAPTESILKSAKYYFGKSFNDLSELESYLEKGSAGA
ncbi:MAG: RuvC family protein [Sulfobacillus sp.]